MLIVRSIMSCALAVALGGLIFVSPARADDKIGVALGVENIVLGTLAAKIRNLAKDAPVNQNETIETKAASQTELLFNDFTTLSIGAASTIVLDEFVYSAKGTQKITFNALKGAFRFVTGQARKTAYKVKTPTAVIGVRGTDFAVYVNKLGTTLTLLHLGAVRVCLWLRDAAGKRIPSEKCVE
ncbi:MAG: FecR family protein, partial [Alphaproteobacteria bacterium]